MKPISIETAIKATGAIRLTGGSGTITSVVTDSRKIVSGSLFVCLSGSRSDGHDYLGDALERGAVCAFCEKLPAPEIVRKWLEAGKTLLRVEGSERALMDLAKEYLAMFRAFRVGVTGSVGKTTTKDMTAKILERRYKTVKTEANHNNNIGLPLTVFTVDDETEAVVLEMGTDTPGEIHGLAEIVRPNVAIITTIGTSHMERLGSREAICEEKCAIADFMDETGTLVVNSDNDLLGARPFRAPYRVLRTGETGEDVLLSDVKQEGNGISFSLMAEGETARFHLPLPGLHNAMNASLAAAAALRLGISLRESAEALADFSGMNENRLTVKKAGTLSIVDDTYNASPESMKAAIDTLMMMEGGRKVAILGDMFELGEAEKELHGAVGNYAGRMGVDLLLTCGTNAMYLAAEYVQMRENALCKYYETKAELLSELRETILPGDTILVKGSRGMHLEDVVKALLEANEEGAKA